MVRRTRAEMEETRAALIATARRAFTERGYAEVSMDDLTSQAGFTRGALYHHFGDKKGLLAAVVEQIDEEMDVRLKDISDNAVSPWEGFHDRCHAYLRMALEPDVHRIVLRDARAVLENDDQGRRKCVSGMAVLIEAMIRDRVIEDTDADGLAVMIFGSLAEASVWIAAGEDGADRLEKASEALDILLRGIRLDAASAT